MTCCINIRERKIERENERKRERTDISKVPHWADKIWVRFVFYMTNKFIMNIVL